MNCSKCNGKLLDGCCTKCGHLQNGNKITKNHIDKNEDLKLFNKDFNIINENKNLLLISILGPLYFSYRGYLLIGTIIGIIDYLLFYYLMNVFDFVIFITGTTSFTISYLLMNRLIYVIFSNYICILIDKFKIKRIKKKYKEDYKNKLKEYSHSKINLLITLLIYFILISIFIIIKRVQNGLL